MKNNFKKTVVLFYLSSIAIFLFACKRETIKIDPAEKFTTVKTENKVLAGYGINKYQYYTPNADSLYIKLDKAKISYSINSDLRIHKYVYTSDTLSLTLTVDDRGKKFTLKSSKQDNIDLMDLNKSLINTRTNQKVDPMWFTKLNFDYQIMIKMMEAIQEIQVKEQFVSSIKISDKKIDDAILIKKASLMSTSPYSPSKKLMVGVNPCSEGSLTCVGTNKYDATQSLACDFSKNTLGGACSNEYCIGYCDFLGCDCVCVFLDYVCWCTSKGRYCTGPSRPIGEIGG